MDENNTGAQGMGGREQTVGAGERPSFAPSVSGTGETSGVRSNIMGPEPKKSGALGPIIGIIIIVILVVLAGFYFWGRSLEKTMDEGATSMTDDGVTMKESDIGTPLSTSDELDTIETDLNATVLESLDAELGNIDAELSQ